MSNITLNATRLEDSVTPLHYQTEVTPWDLQRCMNSSGNAFVDSRRADAIEYIFRMKGNPVKDLKKARHCLDEAIKLLESQPYTGEELELGAFGEALAT